MMRIRVRTTPTTPPMRPLRPLVLGVLLAAPLLAASVAPLAAQAVTPRFAWKAGQVAEVTTTVRMVTEIDGEGVTVGDSTILRFDETLTVAPDPRGLALLRSGGRTVMQRAGTLGRDLDPAADPTRLAGVIVSADGHMLAFRDTIVLRRAADSATTAMLARFDGLPPQAKQLLARSMSTQALGLRVMQLWHNDVGQWMGRAWAPRDSLVDSTAVTAAIVPAPGAASRRVRRFDGVVPCPEGHTGRCLSFTETMRVGAAAMRPFLQAQSKALGLEDAAEAVAEMGDMESITTVVRIVDADDFRPVVQRWSTVSGMGGMASSGRMERMQVWRWR
jgi:hypothetical protein